MSNILVTGDRGFIAGYLIEKLLNENHTVIGIDNDWKYGFQEKSFDNHKNYIHYDGDVKDVNLLTSILEKHKVEYFIAAAAWIGGISFFHKLAYDLLAENERIFASAFDSAIFAHKNLSLKKIVVISSSMVFENTKVYPTPESEISNCPPPDSTYGFQKLATEYFCRGAWEQYQLPYTIVRPFNAVGIGEKRAKLDEEVKSGNIKLAFSHVVPDLIQKIYKGQNPLYILGNGKQVRHYTYGGDIADGIYECIFNPKSVNEDFNISNSVSTDVLTLAEMIWDKLNIESEFQYVCDDPFSYDVQKRVPDVSKAKELLGFEAKTDLNSILDEVIPWVCKMVDENQI
jgi:nucleoside-diphosphate-sugar epimerase